MNDGSSVIGALLWVGGFVGAGFFFGNLPFVEKHFTKIVLAIVFLSLLPLVYGWWSTRDTSRKSASKSASDA